MTVYLTEKHLIRMNILVIATYSPKEDTGIRDFGVLQMIVAQPQQVIAGVTLYPTLEEKAAILLINCIQKHPFQNGNKRTGMMAVDTFLRLNGRILTLPDADKVALVVGIATHRGPFDALKEHVTTTIRTHIDAWPH